MTNTYANKSDLKELLDSCEEYMLQKLTALQIISEVLAAVMEWRSLVTRLGIAKSEQERFVAAFERKFGLYNESEVKVGGCPSITNILG